MALIDELKEDLQQAVEFVDKESAIVRAHQRNVDGWLKRIDDLDLAIAALQPGEVMITVTNDEPDLAAPIVNTDEGWELEPETQAGVEIPEGFTKWEGGAFPFDFDDKVHLYLANGEYRWDTNAALWLRRFESGEVLAYHVIKASAQDETPDQGASESVVQTSPGEAEESRDQFEEEAQRAAAIELTADVEPLPQPEWNEPQTEGYAPVVDHTEAHIQAVEAERYAQPTNPEADFWSRGLAADQKPQSRFNIFGIKKVDA